MATLTTQQLVDDLLVSFGALNDDSRQRYVFEQSLHALVRLAKAEQMLEIKASVRKLTDTAFASPERSALKAFPRD